MTKYPWQAIDPRSYLQIESINPLSMPDVHVLTKLYQPLIGGRAHSLYLTLFAELHFEAKTKGVTVAELFRKLNIGISDFCKAGVRVEGIGLLRIYRGKDNREESY